MTRKYDQIIVVDIECTCWDTPSPPDGQENEIIEIGICRLRLDTGERFGKRSIIVRPERSVVSPFCTQLTTLTQQQVDAGISFPEACAILEKDYKTRARVWASYGDYDRQMFERQCAARDVPYPYSSSHMNIKTLFTLLMGMRHDVGMVAAMGKLNLTLEGTHHRGDDDAWNTADILMKLIERGRK